jgi:predicted transcriptional regulator
MGREGAYHRAQAFADHDRQGTGRARRAHAPGYERRSESQTQKQLVTDLLDRVFDGSAAKLVLHALSAGKATPAELAEIRKLLDKHRGGRK